MRNGVGSRLGVVASRWLATAAWASAALLGACGSGAGGGASPEGVPDATSEVTEADLAEAGVPGLPLVVPKPVFARTETVGCNETITLGKDEVFDSRGLAPTAEGFVTAGIPQNATSRIVAWLMYEVPCSPGTRTRSISLNFETIDFDYVVAVGNYTDGGWEIGQRITVPLGSGDDTLEVRLSTSQRYNRGDGRCFVLLLCLHPGTGQLNGYRIEFQDVLVSSFHETCLEQGFASREEGSVDWGDDHLSVVAGNYIGTQSFTNTVLDDEATFLFPQPLQLEVVPPLWFLNVAGGDVTGDGVDYLFYDPRELNGARHPYALSYLDDVVGWDVVGATPLVTLPGGTEPDAIIAVLIGMLRQPLAGVQVELRDDTGQVVRNAITDARGQFVLTELLTLSLVTTYSLTAADPLSLEALSINFGSYAGGRYLLVNGTP